MPNNMELILSLAHIQNEVSAPKDQSTNRYNFRKVEDILESVKPIALSYGCAVYCSDEEIKNNAGEIVAVKGTATIANSDKSLSVSSIILVNKMPKGMSIEQSSGSASTYARKRALEGLFALDNSKDDPDGRPHEETTTQHIEQGTEQENDGLEDLRKEFTRCHQLGMTNAAIMNVIADSLGVEHGTVNIEKLTPDAVEVSTCALAAVK